MKILVKAVAVDEDGNEQEITLETTPFILRRVGRRVEGETELGTFNFEENSRFNAFPSKEQAKKKI